MIKTHIPARPRNKKIVPTGGASISPSTSSAVGSSHTHNNKSLLDLINQGNIDVLSKLFVDESDNLYTTQNFYSQQEISAHGMGSGGSGGGGDISKLPSWAEYTPAMVDYYVSAGLLVPFYNDMQSRVSYLEGGVPPSQHSHTISGVNGLQSALDGKVDNSQVLTNVPAGAKFTDTIYTHPSHTQRTSGLYKITVNSLGHVTGATAVVKADITELGIPAQDTIYTHPASHSISFITGLQTALDGKASSTHTHSGVYEPVLGNPTVNGYLLSSTTTGTRSWVAPYSLPTASGTTLGGVKIGERLSISSGVLSADVQSDNNFTTTLKNKLDGIETNANNYSLPTATASVLGGVKIGTNVTISNGVISVHNPLTIGTANGLSLSTQQLSLALATTTGNGALSATDKVYINLLRTFFEHDTTNNAIKALKPFYSVGEVSAYGLGSGGSGGGGDISKLQSWAGYTSAMADYYVPASLLVPFYNDMQARVSDLEDGGGGGGSTVTWGTESDGYVPLTVEGVSKSVALSTHTHSQYALNTALTAHINKVDNPHSVTKAQVGLSNVLNVASYSKTESDTNLTSAIDNIEIGGRNLLVGSKDYSISNPLFAGSTATDTGIDENFWVLTLGSTYLQINIPSKVAIGEKFTFSFIHTRRTNSAQDFQITYGSNIKQFNSNSDVQKLVFTAVKTSDSYLTISRVLGGSGWAFRVDEFQLEKGDKATDWSPAPEDELISNQNLWIGTEKPITRSGGNYTLISRDLRGLISEGDICTLQFDITTTLAYNSKVYLSLTQSINVGNMTEIYSKDVPLGKSRYRVTFIYKDISTRPYLIFYKNEATPDTAIFENLTLVKGTKAVWAPAPEDQISDWNTTDVASLSYIKNKPTTLSGYGITDAVTLNTTQTIAGVKTFDANIILGVNRFIQGTDNYTGVWNVDNLLWRFGSSKAGSVANIRSEKVGIGTDNPLYKLDVSGDGRFTGNVTAPTITASTSVTTPKVIFAAAGWSLEQSGTELQMKYNGVVKQRMLSNGSIVATGEVTAFV